MKLRVRYNESGSLFYIGDNTQIYRWKAKFFGTLEHWPKDFIFQVRCSKTVFFLNTTQVNKAFRARWLVLSEVIRKYHTPPRSRRDKIARQKFNSDYFFSFMIEKKSLGFFVAFKESLKEKCLITGKQWTENKHPILVKRTVSANLIVNRNKNVPRHLKIFNRRTYQARIHFVRWHCCNTCKT